MMDIFELHADTCKALASPARLRIIAILGNGELAAGDIVKALGVRKANVSQHLAVMRQRGIVQARKEGLNVYYRLASPKVIQACELMREVLEEQIAKRGELMALHRSEPVAAGKGEGS